MKSGTDTDIRTGLPLAMINASAVTDKAQKSEQALREQAEFLGLAKSPEGLKLLDLIEGKLFVRISQLITQDAEAKTYVDLLTTLGLKENAAKKAVAQLVRTKVPME